MGNRGIVLWTLSGVGVFLLYAAYKNQSPQTLLTNHLNGTNASQPISGNSTPPQITDSQGKTWDTAPGGSGGYITTEPPGSNYGGYMLGSTKSYTTMPDGIHYALDQNGSIVAALPNAYQSNPGLYIRPVSA